MASPKLTDAEALAIVEKQRQERLQSTKDFFIGIAKAATTDLPGFLMDVADKAIDPKNVSFGEFDRSSELFEKLTGIKSSGSISEFVGSLISPAGALGAAKTLGAGIAKAVIIPASLGPATKAKKMEAAGKSADEIYQATKIYRDPVTNSLKEVIPDTGAAFKPGAINVTRGHNNPSRVGQLSHDIFTEKSLEDILSHPFMDQLMGVENAKVGRLIMSPEILGSYTPDKDTIRLAGGKDPNEMLSTLLHETQHALQARAGTQGGGNTGMFFEYPEIFNAHRTNAIRLNSVLENEFDKAFKNSQGLEGFSSPSFTLDRLMQESEWGGIIGERAKEALAKIPLKTFKAFAAVKDSKDASRTLNKAQQDAFQGYENLLGEAEARLVQTQHRLDDYTTHPLKLMAEELGVNVDELPKVLIGDVTEIKPLDRSPEVREAMAFVEKLMQARAAQGKPTK